MYDALAQLRERGRGENSWQEDNFYMKGAF